MAPNNAPQGTSTNYPAPVTLAYRKAALRIGIQTESLEQFVHGRMKATERLAILAEELMAAGCPEQALELRKPIDAAIAGGPVEDLMHLLQVAQRADASEDCAEVTFLTDQTPENLKRYLSENDDAIAKGLRVQKAGYALLAKMRGEA